MAASASMNVSLRKFDMKKIPQDAVAVFIGRRRTGKSTLVRDLLFNHQNMPLGTVISGTEESNSFYGKMIPPLFIHGEYSAVILSNFVKRQKMMMNEDDEEFIDKDHRKTYPNYKSFNINKIKMMIYNESNKNECSF